MKQVLRCHVLSIKDKLRCDLRMSFDDRNRPEFSTNNGENASVNVTIYPSVSLTILHPKAEGQVNMPSWQANDSLGMTKFTFPVFMENIMEMQKAMKTPKLYTYHRDRLELDESEAEKIRRVFKVGNVVVEFSAVIIILQDETRAEGVKMKFNNEQSATVFTLNELDSLVYNLYHLDIDTITLLMYLNYYQKPNYPQNFDANQFNRQPHVDIDIKPLSPQRMVAPTPPPPPTHTVPTPPAPPPPPPKKPEPKPAPAPAVQDDGEFRLTPPPEDFESKDDDI